MSDLKDEQKHFLPMRKSGLRLNQLKNAVM